MTLRSVKTIRALSRGLHVLRTLHSLEEASLDELNKSTQISKPTLSRILLTLQDEKLALQRLADNKWVVGCGTVLSNGNDASRYYLVQAASRPLRDLCEKIIWPSDLTVRRGDKMVMIETSRSLSLLNFHRLNVDFAVDFLLSAPGLAYLAFCPSAERQQILDQVCENNAHKNLLCCGHADHFFKQIREQGYAVRDFTWGGQENKRKEEFDDGLNAISVPIMHEAEILGCINITWKRTLLSHRKIVQQHLSDLQETSKLISAEYLRLSQHSGVYPENGEP